ncbi:MAG: Wzz/FepE/Etk N-terminal domain-containing protein [Hyphomicrobium sp.]
MIVHALQTPHVRTSKILRRRWKLIAATCLAVGALVGAIAVLLPPRFTAKAQVVLDPMTRGSTREPVPASAMDDAAVETHVAMLASESHLRRVLDSFIADRTGKADDKISKNAAAQLASLSIEELADHLKTYKEHRSRVITVAYTSTSAEAAAAIANRIVDLYLAYDTETRLSGNDAFSELDSQIQTAKAETNRARTALEDYRKSLAPSAGSAAETTQEARSAIRVRELERQANAYQSLQEDLVRQRQTLMEQSDIRVLSYSTPPEVPSSPNPLLFFLPGVVLAAIAAGVIAVGLEQLDHSLHTRQDVRRWLGISSIGMLPQMPLTLSAMGRRRPHIYVKKHPFSDYTEALRSIVVAALDIARPTQAAKVFLVTSSVEKEGQSAFAITFATYAGMVGKRVLLIDLDFRTKGHLKGLGKFDGGILEAIEAQSAIEFIRGLPAAGFDYLPMSRTVVDPVALFTGDRLTRMLRELRMRYDVIVIHGAPIIGASETRLLAAMADKVILAVAWGDTRKETANSALALIKQVAAGAWRVEGKVSAVLTGVRAGRLGLYEGADAEKHPFHVARWRPLTKLSRLNKDTPNNLAARHAVRIDKGNGSARGMRSRGEFNG